LLEIRNGVARFKDLFLPHGFSTRALGNMAYRWGPKDEVDHNAKSFYKETGLDRERRVHMLPQHGNKVVLVDDNNAGQDIECDALVTVSRGLTLSLCPADCLPIIITGFVKTCAETNERLCLVALVHAGWKGTRGKVVCKALERIRRNPILIVRGTLTAYLGPGVGPCCYKPNALQKSLGVKSDLVRENAQQLADCGVETIIFSNCCTSCAQHENGDHLFFSHQRAKRTKEKEGRFIATVSTQPLSRAIERPEPG